MCTFHFITPDETWPDTPPENYENAETAFDTWWGDLDTMYTPSTKLVEYRWYRKAVSASLWGPPGRVTPRNLPGVTTGSAAPPQCALAVTEFTDVQEREAGRTIRHWGRFYLPAVASTILNTDGSLLNTWADWVADKTDTLYTTLATTVRLLPCVRTTGVTTGGLGSHVPVREIRVNNVIDTQRSRKWDTITHQANRDLPDYWGP